MKNYFEFIKLFDFHEKFSSFCVGVSGETKEVLVKNLRRDFPRELVPIVLAPLIYPNSTDLLMDKINQEPTSLTNAMVSPNHPLIFCIKFF